MNAFETLNGLNINGHTETKTVSGKDLTYLSWPWAWAEVKKHFPDAHYTIWKNEKGLPYTVDPLTGFMVYTSVTIEGITHEMWLPVMDGANRAMKAEGYDYTVKNPNFKWAKWNDQKKGYYDKYGNEQPEYLTKHCEPATMMDINKTIMRCLVKNLAMFGLGLYIYAGEDLPEVEKEQEDEQKSPAPKQASAPKQTPTPKQTPEPKQASAPKQAQKTGNASVTTGNVVPPPEPLKPAPPDITTATGYIKNELVFMGQKMGLGEKDTIARFSSMKKALVDGGIVTDKQTKDMTLDEAKALVKAVYDNFFDEGVA